jgi:putative nucleotidyltransferase with HDIG domain
MPADENEIARQAFATAEWRSAADAIFQATGVTVNVMDFESGETLAGDSRCAHCHVADIECPSPSVCFDVPPKADSGPARVMCRAGLPSLITPVLRDGRPVAHVLVSGFVTSTRDRRRLWELLAARGTREDSVRLAVKSITVVSRAEAEGYLHVALACARTLVEAAAERLSAAERVEELRLFVTAGQQVATTESLDAAVLGGVAEEAVSLVGGEAGAVLRPSGGFFEIIARTEKWRGAVGTLVPRGDTAASRAATTGRTVVAKSGRSNGLGTLALPLLLRDRVLGVLEVRIPAHSMPVSPERVARLDRFARFVAIALSREEERAQVERAMAGYQQLNELAAALGGVSDLDGAISLIVNLLDSAFEYQVAGVILSSWDRDQADIAINGEPTVGDVDYVLGEIAGRDMNMQPFARRRTIAGEGEILPGDQLEDEWALASIELEYGDLVIGYLFVARCDGGRYKAADRALLAGIASHAGAAFGRVALFTRIRDDYAKTIAALSATLDAGEHMPSGHSNRVMEYAMLIGEELDLPFEDVEQLRFAGLLHDIGKTGLPSELLLKPSKLSPDELARVRMHAELGASIVDQIEFLKTLTPIILHHHERWDGSGYPNGLAAEDIPLLSRILAIADAFDAMTTTKSYKKQLTFAQARKEMRAQAGAQFDPRLVDALFAALDREILAGSTGLMAPEESKGRPELPA